MQRSTLLRDLSRYLQSQARDFLDAGLVEWAGHLEEDADRLAKRADVLMRDEPPLPSIESLTGILGNRDTAEPDDVTRLQKVIVEVAELLESVEFDQYDKVDNAAATLRQALVRSGAENDPSALVEELDEEGINVTAEQILQEQLCPSCGLTRVEHTEWAHDMGLVSWGTLKRECEGWPGSLGQTDV